MTWPPPGADSGFVRKAREEFKYSAAKSPLSASSRWGTGNECLPILNDPPHGNEDSYNGLRLTIIADRGQEVRP